MKPQPQKVEPTPDVEARAKELGLDVFSSLPEPTRDSAPISGPPPAPDSSVRKQAA